MAKILKQGEKLILNTNIEVTNPYLTIDSFDTRKASEGECCSLTVKIWKDKETREEAKTNKNMFPIKVESHNFNMTIDSFEDAYLAISGKLEGQDGLLDNKYPEWEDLFESNNII